MAKTAHGLREEVLALPARERARIAVDLLASLDSETVDENEIDQLWSAETHRRAAMLEAGEGGPLTWDDIQQHPVEPQTYPLGAVAQALRDQLERRVTGKSVLVP